MEYERKGVTITWLIENVEYICRQNIELYSPEIFVDVMDGTKWKLGLHQSIKNFRCGLTIRREAEDNGTEEFGLHYEFSVKARRGTFSTPEMTDSYTFRNNQMCDQVLVDCNKMFPFRSPNTITIRCKLWRQQGSILKSGHFFVRTRTSTECCRFVGVVNNFFNQHEGKRKTLKTISSSQGEKLMTVNLYYFDTREIKTERDKKKIERMQIEIKRRDKTARFLNFKLFILDSAGCKTDIKKIDRSFLLRSSKSMSWFVSKKFLMKYASQYVPNNTLSLHCEISFYSGIECEKLERSGYEPDSVPEVRRTDFSNSVEFLTTNHGIPCDMKLQTATEIFPVHTTILKSQSPVFDAMFKANMKETIQKCVCIDDVDVETVKRMLLFMYSNTLEELDWKDAMKLYFAADKYHIFSLKQKCTIFLKENIDLSNCCVLLLMADMHQDEELNRDVQNYITHNVKKILSCDQWKSLENNHPHLVINYLRGLCLGNNIL